MSASKVPIVEARPRAETMREQFPWRRILRVRRVGDYHVPDRFCQAGGSFTVSRQLEFKPYNAPAGGWGSVRSLFNSLTRERVPASGSLVLSRQNKAGGFACVSCAWAKPAHSHLFEFCENGAKATTWEITHRRADAAFFSAHRVSELEAWPDHDLEELGRLTHPMRWDPETDKYLPVSWQDAFTEIGARIESDRRRIRRSFTHQGARRWRPRICMRCSRGCMGPTISRTVPTCAMRRPRWRCRKASACPSAQSLSTISRRPTAYFSSAKMLARMPRVCCMIFRTPASAACRSSRSIRYGNEDLRNSSIPRHRPKC